MPARGMRRLFPVRRERVTRRDRDHHLRCRLHFGVLNDCHFTDPSQARCLKHVASESRTGPVIAACQPARCANASIHHEHLPGWRAVIAHTDELLSDPVVSRKVPSHERERIAQQRDEHVAVITAFQADA